VSIFDLFWLFFIITAIWPALQQKILERARLCLMREMEKKRGSRVIALIHRQEVMSLLGFPLMRYIDIQDSEEVLRAIRMTDKTVHTPGGLVLAAEQIAHALCKHPAKVTVFVPHYAMSGGTLIALAADEIVMDENAVLGPVDPQLGEYPAVSVLRVLEQKDINEIDDRTLILADVARKAMEQVRNTVQTILADHLEAEKARELAQKFSEGRWTHDYPITVEEASQLGLPVSTEMPDEICKLMNLYRQPAQKRPSVQYIPIPYRGEEGGQGGK